jgi:hypothetical protein
MSKKQTANICSVYDNVKDLYLNHDPVIATQMIIKLYGTGMNDDIDSSSFRITLWQICHSLESLEHFLNTNLTGYEEVEFLALEGHDDPFVVIAAKHLMNSLDAIRNSLVN